MSAGVSYCCNQQISSSTAFNALYLKATEYQIFKNCAFIFGGNYNKHEASVFREAL